MLVNASVIYMVITVTDSILWYQTGHSKIRSVCGPFHWCLQSLVRVEDVSGEECAAKHWVWAQMMPVAQASICTTRHAFVPNADVHK